MTAKHGIKFETFVDQFPRKLEKALPGFRIIRSQGDELEYEFDGFDNALDLKIVHDKFQHSKTDLNGLVERYADYVRQFAAQSRQPKPAAVTVQHYDGYSEKEADWFQKAAAEQRQKLKTYAPPPPPPPVSAPSNRHPNVIKVKSRRRAPEQPLAAHAPLVAAPAPSPAKPSSKGVRVKAKPAKSAKAKKSSASRAKAKTPAKKSAKPAAKAVAASRPRSAPPAKKSAAKPRFMDRVKKLFGRR